MFRLLVALQLYPSSAILLHYHQLGGTELSRPNMGPYITQKRKIMSKGLYRVAIYEALKACQALIYILYVEHLTHPSK